MIEFNVLWWILKAILFGTLVWKFLSQWQDWQAHAKKILALPHPKFVNQWTCHLHDIAQCPSVPGKPHLLDTFRFIRQAAEDHEKDGCYSLCVFSPTRLPFLSTQVLMLTDPALIDQAMSHPDLQEKGSNYDVSKPLIRDSVLTTTGHDWKRMRKLTNRAFSTEILNNTTESVMNLLDKKVFTLMDQGEEIDVVDVCCRFALDVIGKVAFSMDLGGLDELHEKKQPNQKRRRTLYKVFDELLEDLSFFARTAGLYKIFPVCPRFRPNIQYLNATIRKVVKFRRQIKDESSKYDLMSQLFETDASGYSVLSEKELLGNTKTFMFAGHDTVASTLSFMLYETSRLPHVVDKLRKETDSFFDDGRPTYTELRSLPYVDAVVRETLRLHPPAMFSRTAAQEVVLKTKKHHIVAPKGIEVMVAPWLTQRLHTTEDATKFNPDRTIHKDDAYLPFAVGARNCVGREMALAELRAFLVYTVHHFDFMAPSKEVVEYSRITLNPTDCRMKFVRRVP